MNLCGSLAAAVVVGQQAVCNLRAVSALGPSQAIEPSGGPVSLEFI